MSQASALRQSVGALHRTQARPSSPVARLRVVPAAIERTGTGAFAAICMVALAVGLLTLLMLNTQLATGAFTLHELQISSGTLADQEHELTRTLDAERNPASLAKRAVDMGMVPATSMAFIRLDDGTILGEAVPAPDRPITVVTSPRVPPPAPAAPPSPSAPAASSPAASAPAAADAAAVAADPEVPEAATTTSPAAR